jgi:hypothetical protein
LPHYDSSNAKVEINLSCYHHCTVDNLSYSYFFLPFFSPNAIPFVDPPLVPFLVPVLDDSSLATLLAVFATFSILDVPFVAGLVMTEVNIIR